MAFDLNDVLHLQRLRRAVETSRRKLEPFRRRHKRAVELFAGDGYGDEGESKPQHLNMMELAINIYERHLVGRPPQVNIFTRNPELGPTGAKLEAIMNDLLKQFKIHASLQRAVRSALFSLGIVKVGSSVTGSYSIDNFEIDRQEPFVKSILLDDWVHDMSARHWEDIAFAGHRYRMPVEMAREEETFKKDAREKLNAADQPHFNEFGGDERIHTLSQGYGMHEDEYEPYVELWEIWLPRHKQLVTLSPLDGDNPLRVVDWTGPDEGPFHPLWFNEVDGQTMPLSPAMLWSGMHELINGLYRKLERQANRYKRIGVTRGEDTEDAETLRQTSDGEIAAVLNPDAIQEKAFGGIDQQSFAFMLQSKDLFSWLCGNLDSLGGLGASSETVGQDAMLRESSSQRISHMQDSVMLWTKRVLSDFGYYIWSDPIETYPSIMKVPGMGNMHGTLSPMEREEHSYYYHEVDIRPYSMQFQSPQQRMSVINQLMQQVILPTLPMLQQQGLQLNLPGLMETYAKYADLPELKNILIPVNQGSTPSDSMQPTTAPESELQEEGSGDDGRVSQSPVTHRTNERVSRPGATRQGAEASLVQTMMGGNPQQSEQDAMNRHYGG